MNREQFRARIEESESFRAILLSSAPAAVFAAEAVSASGILNPANKTYFEMPNVGKEAANMDVNEALKGLGKRKLVGEETVNGYPCDKYVFVYNDKSMGTLNQWISKKLKIAIKMESEGSPYKMVTEYKNIKEGPIADSIFDLPAGYAKINLPGRR